MSEPRKLNREERRKLEKMKLSKDRKIQKIANKLSPEVKQEVYKRMYEKLKEKMEEEENEDALS